MKGLTNNDVIELRKKYGKNELVANKKENLFIKIFNIICEPMFLLLIISATIYFFLGESKDGIIMLIFVIGIIGIDVIQEWKTDKTLNALKDLSEPKIMVLRDGIKQEILSGELVPGDIMYIHEGIKIPADGYVVECNGLKVNESSLTGESVGVWKSTENKSNLYWKENYCYQGTLVEQGTAVIKVDKIGMETEYGKIGLNIAKIKPSKTRLQKQTDNLVKITAIIALILFILVSIFTFVNLNTLPIDERIIESVLSGITLAMAMIPEEYPVVLTVFLSMGAWRLAKKHALIKKMPAVETLGAVTVLCVDKTGTITKNQMEVTDVISDDEKELSRIMCLSSDPDTYDPMEKAMFKFAKKYDIHKNALFKAKQIKNFPFDNNTKIVGSIRKIDDECILAVKGSPESIINLCELDDKKINLINKEIVLMQERGLRTIAVAKKHILKSNDIPSDIRDVRLEYVGIVGLIDPPRENIYDSIKICTNAGIRLVMITGDNGLTAQAVANSVGIVNTTNIITGEELNKMSDKELEKKIRDTSIFSRVIPEHKMRIVRALQNNGEIVAMTGDGVNDAPALKQADIGIAMGKNGSEVSKEASDLILLDDNFSSIVETIEDGRRIYDNIKKAIRYILIIHIPIALSSLIAPLLGIGVNNLLLLPIHIVLLEILIDPTCSIILERQPAESNIMKRRPRSINDNIINFSGIMKSIIQGIVIFLISFLLYYYYLNIDVLKARTMGLLIIVFANIFLIQVNSSEYDFAFENIRKLIRDNVMIISNLLILLGVIIIVYSPFSSVLKLTSLNLFEISLVIILSFVSVFWYEILKIFKKD